MKNAIRIVAAHAYSTGAAALKGLYFAGLIFLAGCSSLQPSPRPLVYDFGPGALPAASAKSVVAVQDLPAVMLADVEAPASLDTAAVVYRLAYSDPQQLRPYGLARWSMPPSQLLRQRLRETLGHRRAVLDPAQGVLGPEGTLTVRLELLEFSQVFTAPQDSSGVVRLRATLSQPGATGERLVAQADFVTRRASSSADASGGVRALTQASDAVVQEVDAWLQKHPAVRQSAPRP